MIIGCGNLRRLFILIIYLLIINFRFAQGRKAEKLIWNMMAELGFIVIPFGYEYILPQFANRNNLLKGKAGELVRGQPDFLIVNPKTNYAYFIEVKSRVNEGIDVKDIAEYPESWVILVAPGTISIAKADYVINSSREDCFQNLTEIGPFKHADLNVIMNYVRKTIAIF